MPADIVVSIRFNDILKIRKSKLYHEGNIAGKIEEVMRDIEKQVDSLTTEVMIIDEYDQKAIDIGLSILSLIDEKVYEKVDGISLCRG